MPMMMAPRCSSADAALVVAVVVGLVVTVAVAVAAAPPQDDRGAMFRLDFSPFATFDLPRRLIHPRNRAAMGDGKTRRAATTEEQEEKRDPCYSVVVKLGKSKIIEQQKSLFP